MTQKYLGIDFSGNANQWRPSVTEPSVWIAHLSERKSAFTVDSLTSVQELPGDEQPFDRLVKLLAEKGFAACGIDAPLSLPARVVGKASYSRILSRVAALPRKSRPFPKADVFLREFHPEGPPNGEEIYRATEQYWLDKKLSVRSTTFWKHRGGAPFTVAALELAARCGNPVWPFESSSKTGLLVEAFPAAQLLALGLPEKGYNGEGAKSTREAIVEGLEGLSVDFGEYREQVLASADALDAVICALAARAVRTNSLHTGPDGDARKREGWIAIWEPEEPIIPEVESEDREASGEGESSEKTGQRLIRFAMSVPGVRVDRGSYLRAQFEKRFGMDTVREAVLTDPMQAGIPRDAIDRAAASTIKFHTRATTTASFVAGLPGGFAMLGSMPADIAQFYANSLATAQKLAYLYGWPELLDSEAEAGRDDETLAELLLFLGVMMGVQTATSGLEQLAKALSAEAARRIQRKALTKTAYYPIVKDVLKWIGVKVTKDSFSRGASKVVPVAGGLVSGAISFVSLRTMSRRLQKHLQRIAFGSEC